MSLEQSRRIVEAAGDCWHEIFYNQVKGYGWECVACGELIRVYKQTNPDLAEPKNRHLLIGYVRRICGDDDRKLGLFFGWVLVDSGHSLTSRPMGTTFRKMKAIWNATNEAIMAALLQVIEEGE